MSTSGNLVFNFSSTTSEATTEVYAIDNITVTKETNENCIEGCIDPAACNFNPKATTNDDSCDFGESACPNPCEDIVGCTNPDAENYDETATCDDESCIVIDICNEAEINLNQNLIAYYPFNGNANDESENNNDGEEVESLINEDSAYLFDGENYISIPNSPQLENLSEEFTISITFQTQSYYFFDLNWAVLFDKKRQLSFYYTDQGFIYFNDNIITTKTLDLNVWYNATFILKNGILSFYLDNELIVETTITPIIPNSESLDIGRDVPGNIEYFIGKIDDISIYNRALNECEIEAIYEGEKPTPYIGGCTDETACNYNPEANVDDGNCILPTINDTIKPNITCPFDVIADAVGGACSAIVEYPISASDNCGQVSIPQEIDGFTLLGVFEGHTYFISNSTYQTPDATNDIAISTGGHLLTLSSAEEESFIRTNNTSPIWLGLTDRAGEGNFIWVTGEDSTYTNWIPGEPNDFESGEDWAIMNADGSGRWNDEDFIRSGAFIVVEFDGAFVDVQLIEGLESGAEFPIGTTTVTYIATDFNNNIDTCSFTVTVNGNCTEGCTDETACNYNPEANIDDNSCILPDGCTNPNFCEYNPEANCDDGSCQTPNADPGTCQQDCDYDIYEVWNPSTCSCEFGRMNIKGCMDETAINYNPEANCEPEDICNYPNTEATFPCTILGTWQATDDCREDDYQPNETYTIDVWSLKNNTTFNFTNLFGFGFDIIFEAEIHEDQFIFPTQNFFEYTIYGMGSFTENADTINWQFSSAVDDSVVACNSTWVLERADGANVGCTDFRANNYNPDANCDDGTCMYDESISGCTDRLACNSTFGANEDDGSCVYKPFCFVDCDNVVINPAFMFGAPCDDNNPNTIISYMDNCTCVGLDIVIDCVVEPQQPNAVIGEEYCLIVTVTDTLSGAILPNTPVNFLVSGANEGLYDAGHTDSLGQVQLCYTPSNFGLDFITVTSGNFNITFGNIVFDFGGGTDFDLDLFLSFGHIYNGTFYSTPPEVPVGESLCTTITITDEEGINVIAGVEVSIISTIEGVDEILVDTVYTTNLLGQIEFCPSSPYVGIEECILTTPFSTDTIRYTWVEVPPTCDDNIQNGNETDIDCGGDCPPCSTAPIPGCTDPCAPNYNAAATEDDSSCEAYDTTCDYDSCLTVYEWDAANCTCRIVMFIDIFCNDYNECTEDNLDIETCECVYELIEGCGEEIPTCTDGIQNGNETGIDCGGDCQACSEPTPNCTDYPIVITHNVDCTADDGTYTVQFSVSGGGAGLQGGTYQITGDYIGTVVAGEVYSIGNLAEGTTYSLTVVDDGFGCTASINRGPNNCSKVPIELLHFNGEVLQEGNLLKWSTATEIENDYFSLHRSTNGVDYEMLHQQKGAGTVSVPQNYQFLDRTASSGSSYYQLQQTDFDGTETTVGDLTLQRGETGLSILNIIPMPVKNQFDLLLTHNQHELVQIQIHNHLGQLVYSQARALNPQLNILQLNVEGLPRGVYLLSVRGKDTLVSEKLLKY